MPRIPALVTAAVLAVGIGSGPVRAQDEARAPEIEIREWIRGDGLDRLEDHRGQVVLLEFWNTH